MKSLKYLRLSAELHSSPGGRDAISHRELGRDVCADQIRTQIGDSVGRLSFAFVRLNKLNHGATTNERIIKRKHFYFFPAPENNKRDKEIINIQRVKLITQLVKM